MHRRLRALAALGGASMVVLLVAGTASAGTIVSPTAPFTAPNQDPSQPAGPFPQDIGSFTINFSGFPIGTNVFAEQCDGNPPTTPGYNPTTDCDPGTEPASVKSDSTGAGTFVAYNQSPGTGFYAFRGDSPSALFTCLSPNQPIPPGTSDPVFRNCQLKLTVNDTLTNSSDAYLTMTLPEPGAQVPEAPYAVLLPGGALLLLGGGYVIARKRRRPQAASAAA